MLTVPIVEMSSALPRRVLTIAGAVAAIIPIPWRVFHQLFESYGQHCQLYTVNRMDSCIFCQEALKEKESVVILTSKGCEGIARASKTRGDQIHTEPGQQVHKQCRRVYCIPNAISAYTRNRKLVNNA